MQLKLEHSITHRLLNARPADYDAQTLDTARRWLHACMLQHWPAAPPPDSSITAQFLSIESWPVLEALLCGLIAKRRRPGESYAWFVAVALQRIHGVQPHVLRARRARLQVSHG